MSTVDQIAAQGSAIGAEAARPASINLSSLGVPTSVQGVTAQGPNASPVKYTPALSLERSVESDETLKKHDRSFYVSAFKVGVEKTARATLDMCRVVFEANQVLDAYDFEKFCGEIEIRSGSSTIRKFIAIGRVYPRFINHADQLPIAWTNIYLLTQIPASAGTGAELPHVGVGKGSGTAPALSASSRGASPAGNHPCPGGWRAWLRARIREVSSCR